MTRLEWVSSPHVPANVFSLEESNQFQTNLILAFAVSHVVFQNIRSLRGKDGKVEEIMLGLQDQLVADTEEAIRPQDRRRKLIKHDPIFLPSRGGETIQVQIQTRSSWLNCALRDDDAVYPVSMRR